MNKGLGISQKILFKLLSNIQFGKLIIIDANGSHVFAGTEGLDTHVVKMNINHIRFYKRILFHGSVGAAESYMDADWDVDDLTKLIEIIIRNKTFFYHIDGVVFRLLNMFHRVIVSFHKNDNDIANSKKNILAHYDLGNDFFKLFLDPAMMYSCALYEPERISLEQASIKKLETICQQLQLKPSDHVLEIGTGWGGFAIFAARKYGCKITTTTISDKQYDYVKREVEHLGLQSRIEVCNQDYRQLTGQFDKLVSIEMIEAIGYKNFDHFFHQCNELLKPGGLFFLQAITINDQSYDSAKNDQDFIKQYIFPGGCLPSVNVISNCIAKQTQMQLLQMRDIGKHYVSTLLDWLRRFDQHVLQIKSKGFSEQFIRMWRYYFCYCAAGFRQAHISDIHALWRKRI